MSNVVSSTGSRLTIDNGFSSSDIFRRPHDKTIFSTFLAACQSVHPNLLKISMDKASVEFTKSIDSQVDQGAQSDAEHLAVLDDGSAVGASAKGRV